MFLARLHPAIGSTFFAKNTFEVNDYNEYSPLKLLAVRCATQAFASEERLDRDWRSLRYHNRPELRSAIAEHQQFVEVPGSEFLPMGCNVLATGPRRVLMLDSLPLTKALLEAAGCDVTVYAGDEISRKGEGGPTCLTRPLTRGIKQ